MLCGSRLARSSSLIGRCCTILIFLSSLVAVNIPSNGVLVDGAGEYCGIGLISGDLSDFTPTCKGIGMLCGSRLARRSSLIGRCCAVLIFLSSLFAVNVPSNRVLVDGAGECCGIGLIAGYLCDLAPTCKGVGILCSSLLYRSFALVGRCRTIRIGFGYFLTVNDPGDGICIHGFGELCCVSLVSGNCFDLTPSNKGVGVFCISFSFGCFALVGRCCTVLIYLGGLNTIYIPSDSILVDCLFKCSGVGLIFGYLRDITPACKGVGILLGSRLGGLVSLIDRCCTVFVFLSSLVAVNIPSNGVLVNGAGEYCGIGLITGYLRDITPACKGVGILCGSLLYRSFALVGRCRTIRIGFSCFLAVNVPCDGICIHGFGELCCVGLVSGNSFDLTPSNKGIGVFCISFSFGSFALVGRSCAVLIYLGGLYAVHVPSDGILVDCLIKRSGVGLIAGYLCDLAPTAEFIGVLCSSRLGGLVSLIDRCCTVFVFLGELFTIHYPSDGVFVHRCGEVCGVGLITGYLGNRTPIIKGVGVLCGSCLARSSSLVGRRCAVLVFLCGQSTVNIPCDGVLVYGPGEYCGIGLVACNLGNRTPTLKGVGVLCGIFLVRDATLIGRNLSVLILLNGLLSVNYPSNRIGLVRAYKPCGVGCISGYSGDFAPTGEDVLYLRISVFRRGFAFVGRRCTVLVFLCGFYTVNYPSDGVFVNSFDKLCGIGFITGNRENRSEILEGVCVLCVSGSCRSFALVGRHCAVLIFFGDFRTVNIPSNCVLVDGTIKDRCVGFVSGNSYDLTPTCEGVAVLSGRFLCRCVALIDRHCAIIVALSKLNAIDNPGDIILIHRGVKGCRIGLISCNHQNRTPISEGIGVLCIGLSLRCCAFIGRCCAILIFFGDLVSVNVPSYSILVDGFGELRRVGLVACDFGDLAPACKGVGILCRSRLNRCYTLVTRNIAVSVKFCQFLAVHIPSDGICAGGRNKLRSVGLIACNRFNLTPSVKRIGACLVRRLDRLRSLVGRCCAVFIFFFEGISLNNPCNRVLVYGCVKGCCIGFCFGYGRDIAPACKGVGVLRSRFSFGRFAFVFGNIAPGIHLGGSHTVNIPGDNKGVQLALELCGIGCMIGDRLNIAPTDKGVVILGICGLGRCFAFPGGCCTVAVILRRSHAFNIPRHRVHMTVVININNGRSIAGNFNLRNCLCRESGIIPCHRIGVFSGSACQRFSFVNGILVIINVLPHMIDGIFNSGHRNQLGYLIGNIVCHYSKCFVPNRSISSRCSIRIRRSCRHNSIADGIGADRIAIDIRPCYRMRRPPYPKCYFRNFFTADQC